jgi:hypothetical protein
MIGFNNVGFDYPVLHTVLTHNGPLTGDVWMRKVEAIFNDERFDHIVSYREVIKPQIDLYLIHHFDNAARRTGLKALQFAMRLPKIETLPIKPGTYLTHQQIDELRGYLHNDLLSTLAFYEHTKPAIDMRAELGPRHTNSNDTKIGKSIVIDKLEQTRRGCCYYSDRSPRQTPRPNGIVLSDIILPCVNFKTPKFQSLLEEFKSWTLHDTKGAFVYSINGGAKQSRDSLFVDHDGFKFEYGTGGIHGSVVKQRVTETLLDIDVTSYYPSIAIVNDLYPEHLGRNFCEVYAQIKEERLKHPKGSTQNAAYKLALNGVYGDSNNKYSPFYDPQYTMAITINGQLLLTMLAESLLIYIPDLQMIQINTDGMTVKYDPQHTDVVMSICKSWCDYTRLDLEYNTYKSMFIRDVNNYIAVDINGKIKRKGAYEYKLQWHQNHSQLVVQKAAEAHFIRGVDISEFIQNHDDPYDFMIMTKINKNIRLITDTGAELQSLIRYYISTNGVQIIKEMQPLVKKPDTIRLTNLTKNRRATICNNMPDKITDIDYDFYIREARKLVNYG